MKQHLRFIYRDFEGDETTRTLRTWKESDLYIEGFDELRGAVRTFRKSRVERYLDGCDALLSDPYSVGTVAAPGAAVEILFSGFSAARRAQLEASAASAGLRVVRSETKGLAYFVGGPRVGSSKQLAAIVRGALLLDEAEFGRFIESGELPDSAVDAARVAVTAPLMVSAGLAGLTPAKPPRHDKTDITGTDWLTELKRQLIAGKRLALRLLRWLFWIVGGVFLLLLLIGLLGR